MEKESTYRQIRIVLLVFIVVLFLSGLTAIPIDPELSFLLRIIPVHTLVGPFIHLLSQSKKTGNRNKLFPLNQNQLWKLS